MSDEEAVAFVRQRVTEGEKRCDWSFIDRRAIGPMIQAYREYQASKGIKEIQEGGA